MHIKIKPVECPVCHTNGRPKKMEVEHLHPVKEKSPTTQFTILGKCGHRFKMSSEEMGVDTFTDAVTIRRGLSEWLEDIWKKLIGKA